MTKALATKIAKVKAEPGVHVTAVVAPAGNYNIKQNFVVQVLKEAPKKERLNFKLLPLLGMFLYKKRQHQKVSARGYITTRTLKHEAASKDLVVTPLDLKTETYYSGYTPNEEITKAPVLSKEVKRKINGAVVEKAVHKAHLKVSALVLKTTAAQTKLELKQKMAADKQNAAL